jgi:serine phosphatase RsbU (regulator of sigma subunit)
LEKSGRKRELVVSLALRSAPLWLSELLVWGSFAGDTITDDAVVSGGPLAEHRVRDLESLTDAALAHLDTEQLLTELLHRVGGILGVDTAAVLLRDASSNELVATAARGLEAEVRQGVRIPLGTGFAGRIAAERRPVKLDRIDHTTVANPILWERGIQSMLGVPLLAAGELIGVLHVGTLSNRNFTSEDADLLQIVADRIALAVRASLLEEERAAARALQRILLPSELVKLPTLEFAARYVPSAEIGVGGDWYDVFTLPSDRLCIAIGDVVGHGLQAATVMGRLRAAVRSNALHSIHPNEVLALVDRELQHFEPNMMATVLFGVFEPSLETLQLSSAGHPVPVVAGSDGTSHFVDLNIDPPLGVEADMARTAITADIPSDGVMLLYTDGLIERPDAPLDASLGALLDAVVVDSPNSVCRAVMQRLVGDRVPRDDIAVLAVRRTLETTEEPHSSTAASPVAVGRQSPVVAALR